MKDTKLREALEAARSACLTIAGEADLDTALAAVCQAARAAGCERAEIALGDAPDATAEPGEVALALEAGGERVGTLRVAAPGDPDAETLLGLLAGQAALAIRISRLRGKNGAGSSLDADTLLLNRRGFDEALRREVERAYRTERPLAAVVFEVDRFESVLETPAAAEALEVVADVVRAGLRQVDVAARTGPGQFRALLPGSAAPGARDVAERLRCALAATVVPAAGVLTATFGVAALPEHAANGAGLVLAAEAAVALGKRRGRNCVVVALPIRRQ